MEEKSAPAAPATAPSTPAAPPPPVASTIPPPAPTTPTPAVSAPATSPTTPAPPHKKSPMMLVSIIVLLLAVIGGGAFYFLGTPGHKKPQTPLPTYFSYTDDEKKTIASAKTKHKTTSEDLYRWSEKTFQLIIANKWGDVEVSRLLAYVTTAQSDFAALSYNENGEFVGSVDPVSKEVLCLFFTADCSDIEVTNSDEYSEKIAALVVSRVKERIKEDAAMTKAYTPKEGPLYWKSPTGEKIGIDAGSRKPWALKRGDQFRTPEPPAPDSPVWQEQLKKVKEALAGITNEQRESVIYWAGGPGTKTPPGIWLSLAEEYMQEKKTDTQKVLLVRSQMSQAMAEAVIAVFDSKWTYSIRRPVMLDPTILTVMPTPNHPSHPAGHATISAAAATVLGYYFPERQEKWEEMKVTAGSGRTWGGIHFPIDNEAGFVLGKQVATEVLK